MTLHDRREATDEATPAETAADINDLEHNDLQRNDLEGMAPEASLAGTYRDETAGQPDPAAAESVSAVDPDAARGTATQDSAATGDGFVTADAADAGAAAGTAAGAAGAGATQSGDGRQSGDTAQSADWRQVLLEFVDHPREAVEKADRLVDDAVRALTERINKEHSGLRDAWRTHGEPSTEDLRKALRGYRDFVEKILSSRAAA